MNTESAHANCSTEELRRCWNDWNESRMAMTSFKHDEPPGLKRRDATPGKCQLGASSSGASESPILIDEPALAELIAFFRLLDKWDQEVRCHEKMQ